MIVIIIMRWWVVSGETCHQINSILLKHQNKHKVLKIDNKKYNVSLFLSNFILKVVKPRF